MSMTDKELSDARRRYPVAPIEELEVVHPLVCQDGCGSVLGTRTHVPANHWRLAPGNSGFRCSDCFAKLGPAQAKIAARAKAES